MFSARSFLQATRPMARSFSAQPARQIARVTLVGRLPADAEMAQTSSGKEYVRYAVGNTIKKSNGEEKTSWFRVSVFEERSKEYTLSMKKGYVGG
jgi:single-stranded DNA-binding protein